MKKTILIILLAFFISSVFSQGYKIKIKINHLKNDTLILAHHFNAQMYPDDTLIVDSKGVGILEGKEPLIGGMYILFMPNKTYFDFLIGDNQEFSIENDTVDFLKNAKFTNSKENELFVSYQRLMIEKRKEADELNKKKKEAKNDKEKEKITEKLKNIGKEINKYRDKIINENKDLFVSVFLNSTKEVEIPDYPRDEKGDVIDSSFQYHYWRNHFLDNFDVADGRLLRTPIYENKIIQYIDKVISQDPDTIMAEVDKLIKLSRSSKELFRYMLITLHNHYAESKVMCQDKVFLYIAEKYYIPEADWSKDDYLEKLKETVKTNKPLRCGEAAPNIEMIYVPAEHFMNAQQDTALIRDVHVGARMTLNNINAKYTILWFWEKDCGHCRKQTPQLYKIFEKLNENGVDLKIMSVHMIGSVEGKKKWIDFVNDKGLYDWFNVWSPYSYEYKEKYGIKSTPIIFILDKEKKIIAKKLSPIQVEHLIYELEKRDGNILKDYVFEKEPNKKKH